MRARMASVIRSLDDRGDVLLSLPRPEYRGALADLAYAIENHYVDEHGNLQVATGDE